jgi:hypothetical protein
MNARTTLVPTLAAAALLLVAPTAAQGAPTSVERFDRRAFDSAGVATGSGYAMEGATAGELGGHLRLEIEATDGTVPAQGQCETADVRAVLTVSPGESFAIETTGELCSHFIDGTPILNAYFGAKQVEYVGSHKRARVTDGIIAFSKSFLGAQGSVGLTVRW